jgi:hypothetical protein
VRRFSCAATALFAPLLANIQFRHASIRLIHFNGQNVIVLDTVNRL